MNATYTFGFEHNFLKQQKMQIYKIESSFYERGSMK